MGKTKNHMYTADDTTSMITLKIKGPKCLIDRSEPITVDVKVNSSWEELLNDQLKLNIPLDQGIHIFNPSSNSKMKKGSKWCMELHRKVREYVNQYSHNMGSYTVCIRHPNVANFRKYRQHDKVTTKLKRLLRKATPKKSTMPPPPLPPTTNRRITPLSPPRRQTTPPPPAVASTSRGIPARQESLASWDVPNIGNVWSVSQEVNVERGNQAAGWDDEEVNGGTGRIDDQLSVMTTATEQEEELRRLGIRRADIVDIRSNALRQFDIFGSNSMLLLMRDEIQMLMRENLWARVVRRAPRNAYFLERLLRVVNNN